MLPDTVPSPKLTLLQTLQKHPCGWLLAAQLLGILIYPLLEDSPVGRPIFTLFGNFVLILVLWVVMRGRTVAWVSWMMAVPVFVMSVASLIWDDPNLQYASHLLEAAVYLYATYGLIYHMMGDTDVTLDDLLAAASTFTLMAWAFAFLFSACQGWAPDSFAVQDKGDGESLRTWMELLFLSFSVLSSVGLSDIVPLTPFARALVMIEMFTGVMYIALIVSRLVALATLRVKR